MNDQSPEENPAHIHDHIENIDCGGMADWGLLPSAQNMETGESQNRNGSSSALGEVRPESVLVMGEEWVCAHW